jgi:bacterioferritin
MVQKASPKLTELMNEAIAGELQAIVQYMWHHIMVKGLNSASLMDVFEDIAMDEMKHAEKIAERLFYFDVAPTTKPNPIAKGGTPEQMLKADVKAEEEAITLYKEIIKRAITEKDETTRLLFESILSEEEGHHDTFTTLLGR